MERQSFHPIHDHDFLYVFQRTHTSGGDRDELGCHTGAKDSDQVWRAGIRKCE